MVLRLSQGMVDIPMLSLDSTYVALSETSTSKGTQQKWYGNNSYVKRDMLGYESMSEVLISHLLEFTEFVIDLPHVVYQQVQLMEGGKTIGVGCISKKKKKVGEDDITIGRILEHTFMPFSIKYEELIDLLDEVLDLESRSYIDSLLYLDSIVLNEDRHFHNIAFLKDSLTGKYRPAPIFDNGLALLSDTISYPLSGEYKEEILSVRAKPFYTDFKRQIGLCAKYNKPVIDYAGFLQSVEGDWESCRAFQVLKYQLQVMEGISWIRR